MVTFESLSVVFEKEKIKVFRLVDIGEILKKGLLLQNIEDLLELISSTNVQRVFIYEHCEYPGDYYIDNEIVLKESRFYDDDFIEYIYPRIDEYNRKISELDFSYPSWLISICFCDNNAFFVICNNERKLDGEDLIGPEDMFKIICDSNENQRQILLDVSRNRLDNLRNELRNQILNDDKFKLCTNQTLRRNYAYKTFSKMDKRYNPLKKILYNETYNLLSSEGRDFIEVLWRELKRNSK